jgi:hypothetical protein
LQHKIGFNDAELTGCISVGGKVLITSTLHGVGDTQGHGAPFAFERSFVEIVLFCAAIYGPACIFGVMFFHTFIVLFYYLHTPFKESP